MTTVTKYDGFMNSVGDVGSLTSKDESVDDITSNYVDVESRLKSLNTQYDNRGKHGVGIS